MRSLNRINSQLVINLEAKEPAKEASRIAYAESLGRLACKEYYFQVKPKQGASVGNKLDPTYLSVKLLVAPI